MLLEGGSVSGHVPRRGGTGGVPGGYQDGFSCGQVGTSIASITSKSRPNHQDHEGEVTHRFMATKLLTN